MKSALERPNVHASAPSEVEAALEAFERWLRLAGHTGYDQYDFWATSYGVWAKGMFHRHGALAGALVLPLVAADWLWPASRRWFCPRRRFPIADAHYLMGFAALHRASGRRDALDAAIDLADVLLASSLPGFSGPCWGVPFDWQTKRGLCRQGTPLITSTPYVFDAFLELHEATGQTRYRDVALSIAQFVARDIRDTPVGRGRAASYTPFDDSQIFNASAYRAACMARASTLTDDGAYRTIAEGNARFVLEQQRDDGAWPYSASDPQEAFIDHFHTCFVLKGLYRTYLVLRDPDILDGVKRGYAFYRRRLFYLDGRPRPFAESGRPHLGVLELYDYAEALNLALLLRRDLPTEALADDMAARIVGDFQMPQGYFATRLSRGGVRNRVPYHRWAQAQAFCSLARYYEWRAG